MELVVGPVHAVHAEDGLQAAFVKRAVVRHEGQALDQGGDFRPHIREYRGVGGITERQAVDHGVEAAVILGFRTYQAVDPVGNLSVVHCDDADTAHARAVLVGRLEVYGCKILHLRCLWSARIYKTIH